MARSTWRRWKPLVIYAMRRANVYAVRRMPPVVRSGAGALFIVGGVFGFLPILGFWMIPVGLILIATDIPPARRPIQRWLSRQTNTLSTVERRYPKEAGKTEN
jgi:hypothetical protein